MDAGVLAKALEPSSVCPIAEGETLLLQGCDDRGGGGNPLHGYCFWSIDHILKLLYSLEMVLL